MIICPKCGAKLPDSAQSCTFCNELVYMSTVTPGLGKIGHAAEWVWNAYYAVSGYYIVEGLIFAGLGGMPVMQGKEIGGLQVFQIVIGAVTCLFGVGLLLRVELIRGIMNFFCGLQILFGSLGLISSFLMTMAFGAIGLLMVLLNVLQIATAGFMIYLIGETDRRAPNF